MFGRKAITAKLRHLCLSHNGLFFSQRNSTMAGAGIQKKKLCNLIWTVSLFLLNILFIYKQ